MNQHTKLTLDKFLNKLTSGPPISTKRNGQRCFNFLIQHRPDLAEKCRDTAVDPFYDDSRVSLFIYWVKLMWDADMIQPIVNDHVKVEIHYNNIRSLQRCKSIPLDVESISINTSLDFLFCLTMNCTIHN